MSPEALTPDEMQYIDDRVRSRVQFKAIQGLDGDPDKAAEAVNFEKNTGVDSQAIYTNSDEFKRDYTSYLTQRMLDRNPDLSAYIEAHPMAAIVSKDDWDRMADFYDKLTAFDDATGNVTKPISALTGFGYGFGKGFMEGMSGPLGEWMTGGTEEQARISREWMEKHPYLTDIARAAVGPFETGIRMFSALLPALHEGAYGAAVGAGADESTAQRFARGMAELGEWAMMDTAGHGGPHPTDRAVMAYKIAKELGVTVERAGKAISAAEPYLRAGELPPVGIDPLWDSVAATNARHSMSIYDALIDSADKTGTLPRSPDLMALATELKSKQNIFLYWDRVRQLYPEGKVPEPGDGLLGDIPGIAEKLRAASETESDAAIPISDWISKVAPELRKELHDDIRLRVGEPTLNEVKDIPSIEQAVKQTIEPAVPEEVEPVGEEPVARLTRLRGELEAHKEYLGEPKPTEGGSLTESLQALTGKTYEPNEVIKAVRWGEFNNRPDIVERGLELAKHSDPELRARLETFLGNIEKNRKAMEAIRLETAQAPAGWDIAGPGETMPTVRELLTSPEWKPISEMTIARAPGDLTETEAFIRRLVGALFEKLGGPGVGLKLVAAREIRMGLDRPSPVEAAYSMPGMKTLLRDPTITFLVTALDPIHSLGHEFMHHLRRYRFIKEGEWAALEKAAKDGNWIDKWDVRDRYPDGSPELHLEEAIVDEFGEHLRKAIEGRIDQAAPTVFQRIADFLYRIRIGLKEFFGRDLTPEELFTEIEAGRFARTRRPEGPPMFKGKPLEAAMKPIEGIEGVEKPEDIFLKGLVPKTELAKHLRLIGEDSIADKEKLLKDAIADEKKRQTPEWKTNFAAQYNESLTDLKNRPDYKVAALFRSGFIGDDRLDIKPKINPAFLTEEQAKRLPKSMLSRTDGINPDDIASTFGYRTGSEMVDSLGSFLEQIGKQKPEKFVERSAWAETERRMEMRYGKLDENILREAREHAIGTSKFDLWHQETIRLAEMSGQPPPLSKDTIRAEAALRFNQSISSQVPLIKYTRDLGKLNREAQAAWTKGDALEAFRLRQESLRVAAEAEIAAKFEKQKRGRDQRLLKRYTNREVSGRPPEFTNWVHQIMFQIKRPPKRSPEDLIANIQADTEQPQTLEAFANHHGRMGILHNEESLNEFNVELDSSLPIADFLMDLDPNGKPQWVKDLDATTVGEYKAIIDSIIALDTVGRKVNSVLVAGKEADFRAHADKMIAQMATLGEAWQPPAQSERSRLQKSRFFLQQMRAGLLQMEFVWDRLDRGKRGIFTRTFNDRFAASGAEYVTLVKEFSRKLQKLNVFSKEVDLNEKIPHNLFYDPLWEIPDEKKPPAAENRLMNNGTFSRREFRQIMLNVGNPSNLEKLTRFYKIEPQALMEWINRHATNKDWKWVTGVGKIFEELQDRSDTMVFNMTGVKMERLPLGKVMTDAAGELDGWYWPMIYDQTKGGARHHGQVINPPSLIRRKTVHGWERKRTGFVGPIDFSSDQLTTQLSMRVRDIAFREVLADLGKFFADGKFRNAMTRHLGQSYTDLLNPYLQDIAGVRVPTGKAMQAIDKALGAVVHNTVHVFVGYKATTVLKHNLTALGMTFGEFGPKGLPYLMRSAFDLFSTEKQTQLHNHKWIMEGGPIGDTDFKGSGVLNGRMRNFEETLGGATDIVTGQPTLTERSIEWGAAPVAIVDLAFSKWLWYAKYLEVKDRVAAEAIKDGVEPKPEHIHEEAYNEAEQAVRRVHGETAITSRPQFMRAPMYRNFTVLYGFFNHVFNRLYRMSWQTADLFADRTPAEARLNDVRQITTAFTLNVLWAGYIEHLISNEKRNDDESFWWSATRVALHPIFSAVPLLRDMYSAMDRGADPAFGVIQGSEKALTDIVRIGASIHKKGGLGEEDVGRTIHAMNVLLGVAGGLSLVGNVFTDQLGRWEKFAYNYYKHIDRPRTAGEWYRALTSGTSKEPKR